MTFRERLQDGDTLTGGWIQSCSPIVAEAMAPFYEWLCIDVEHSPATHRDVHQICQAIRSGNPECAPFVRVPGVDYADTKRYLDHGALGIIAPLVNTREQAVELVSACRYPPKGNRGFGFARSNGYAGDRSHTVEPVVVVQIEHRDAVENLDAILSVPGVDAAFIGPYDLAQSYGGGEWSFGAEVMSKIELACVRWGVVLGGHVIGDFESMNGGLIAHSTDLLLVQK